MGIFDYLVVYTDEKNKINKFKTRAKSDKEAIDIFEKWCEKNNVIADVGDLQNLSWDEIGVEDDDEILEMLDKINQDEKEFKESIGNITFNVGKYNSFSDLKTNLIKTIDEILKDTKADQYRESMMNAHGSETRKLNSYIYKLETIKYEIENLVENKENLDILLSYIAAEENKGLDKLESNKKKVADEPNVGKPKKKKEEDRE